MSYQFGKVKTNQPVKSNESEFGKPVYMIYVPYKYKDMAKLDGAKWDIINKFWYIFKDAPNYNTLIQKYNKNNFRKIDFGKSDIIINDFKE